MKRAGVIVFPGSNCDRDMAVALKAACNRPPVMIWHQETDLPPLEVIAIPGGFSHGDYLRAGAVAARSPAMREVVARAQAGTPVLGVCNGFQVLTECGLLPGALLRNNHLRFVCDRVRLKVESADTVFTAPYGTGRIITLPIAHHDGNYFADAQTLARLEGEGRVALRYCDDDGAASPMSNPNGSQHNIAGIVNAHGTVLGMMPHPERATDLMLGGADGTILFDHLATLLA